GARCERALRPHRLGVAPHSSDGPGFAGPVRTPVRGAQAAVRLTGRAVFMATAAAVLTLLLFLAVVRPAIERGGLGEFLGIAALCDRRTPEAWDHASRPEASPLSLGEDRRRARAERAPSRASGAARDDGPRVRQRPEIPGGRRPFGAGGLGDRPTGRSVRQDRREMVPGAGRRRPILI